MIFRRILWLALALAAFGKNAPKIAPVPSDPLEMATGEIQTVSAAADREGVLQLLAQARNRYGLRSAGSGYDLKVSFTVDSGGATEFDGAWEMEDVYDPNQGHRWTAKTAAGYTITEISSNGMAYWEGTDSTVPLRLHEARAALFGAIPSEGKLENQTIRTTTATFRGVPVACILLSGPGNAAPENAANATPGRRWEETEECIDPQSGLLQVHSIVPGRYYAYDYSNAPQLGDRMLPRKVTVTEAGKTVSEISVNSLTELTAADPGLFQPTAEMLAGGRPMVLGEAEKFVRLAGRGPLPSNATVRPVCVFGLVTASGQLVEAHSLEPSDPNSPAAVEAVERMNFARKPAPGTPPQQHFVFVIEKFVAGR